MKRSAKLAAALLLAVTPLAVQAQQSGNADSAPPAGTTELTPEQLENYQRGAAILRTFMIAIRSENVPQAVKSQLYTCMYVRNMRDISAATGRELALNPTLDKNSESDIYRAAAHLCGVVFGDGSGTGKPAPQLGK